MHVVWHDGECVELELSCVAIAEERGDEELGVDGALKVAMLLERGDRDGVRTLLLADCGHSRRAYPRG
jgi:hypothetical protein